MNNQMQVQKGVKIIKSDTGAEFKLSPQIIRQYLVNGNGQITDQECMMFLALCERRRLDPFMKDVYLIKYGTGSPATMVVSKDVILRRATRHHDYNGHEVGVVVMTQDGELKHLKGAIYRRGIDVLVGAWSKVYRKSWETPIYVEVLFDEYAGRNSKTGELNSQWASKPSTMITKVAESQALRKAFIDELQGMYVEDEMTTSIEQNSKPIPKEVIDLHVQQDLPQTVQQAEVIDLNGYETQSEEVVDGNDMF